MQFIKVHNDADVRTIAMSRGKANAMNLVMIEELNSAVTEARNDDAVRAIVISSNCPRFFSSGFDAEEVFAYDPPAMKHFFLRFIDLFDAVLRMPKTIIAAMPGHAYAGGAFLALAFDFRIMAEGEFGFAVNEINLGVMVPPSIRFSLTHIVGPREATRIMQTGDAVDPHRALKIGLADEVVPESEVLAAALKLAHVLGQKPGRIYAMNKQAIQADAGFPDHPLEIEEIDDFLSQWFSPEGIARRKALVASLKARSTGS